MLANPNAPERVAMRRSLLVSNLENTARNLRYTDRLTTFEVGRVYLPEEGDGVLPLAEDRRVCIGHVRPARRNPVSIAVSITKAKSRGKWTSSTSKAS